MKKEMMAALVLGFAAPLALHVAPARAETPAPHPTAVQIAETLLADDIIAIQVENALAAMTTKAFNTDPVMMEMGAAYPGMDKAFYDIMLPIIRDEMDRVIPAYTNELAVFFGSNFNGAELQQLLTFWTSAPAQKTLRDASKRLTFDATATEVASQIGNDDLQISDEAMKADIKAGVDEALKDMSRADLAAVARFALTPVGRKFTRLMPEKQAIDAKWGNSPLSAEAEARIDREVPAAMAAFIAAADRKASKTPAQ